MHRAKSHIIGFLLLCTSLVPLQAASGVELHISFERAEGNQIAVYALLTHTIENFFGTWIFPLAGYPVSFEAEHGSLTPTEDLYELTQEEAFKGYYRSILTPPRI